MSNAFDKLVTAIVTLSAATVAITVAWREFGRPPAQAANQPASSDAISVPIAVSDWEEALAVGVPLNNGNRAINIIEFADLECPFCRQFHEVTMPAITSEFGDGVRIIFVHFPLRNHANAMPAATAAECAREQGRFSEYVEAVFSEQHALGIKPYVAFAEDISVPDLKLFQSCVSTPTPELIERITNARALGDRFGVAGTPTIFLNEWRFPTPPSPDVLASKVRELEQLAAY